MVRRGAATDGFFPGHSLDFDLVLIFTDKIGLHKIANSSRVEPAVSLHLYSPPYQKCKIWTRTTCASQYITPTVCYYSVGGVRVQDGAATRLPPIEDLTSLSWGREEEKKHEETKCP